MKAKWSVVSAVSALLITATFFFDLISCTLLIKEVIRMLLMKDLGASEGRSVQHRVALMVLNEEARTRYVIH